MKTILFEEDKLIISLSSLETILGLKHTIEVPYSNIKDVSKEDTHQFLWKMYGTHLGPSKYGYFKKDGVNYFVASSTNKGNLVLTLNNHKYDKIILELDHVDDVLQQIQNTLRTDIK
ncbi:PH domain-containing protein [Gottfriedia sp. NPDC057948]|uniref:PH domain-containing protein n=1 Tax=Gottfriedia sp. NPDC057948 TaxID=3346287 RepID=UPI0036DB01BA